MSVLLRNERKRGLAGMQRDTAPVEWPRSEGGAWTVAMRYLAMKTDFTARPFAVKLTEASGEGKKGKSRETRD